MKQLLLRGIFWRGLNYLTVFVVTIMIARLFQADGSGVINYSMNNLALVILIAGMSLESGTGYYSAKNEIAQSQLAGISLAGVIFVMFITLVLALLIGFSITFILPAVLYCGGITMMNYFTALYYSHYQYILPNVVVILMNLVLISLMVLFPGWLSADTGTVFLWIYFMSFFITGLFIAGLYILRFAKNLSFPRAAVLKKLYRYALLAMFSNLVFFLVYRVDYWFVFHNSSSEALGNYIQVSKLGQIFMLIPAIIASAVFTKTAKADSDNHIGELQHLSRILLLFYLFIIAGIFVTGKWMFPFVYGDTFRMMYMPFILMSPGILSLSTLTLVTAYNAGRGRLNENLRGGLLALIVIIAGNLIFTPGFGIHSAAIVSSIGYLVYQVYIMLKLKKEIPGIVISKFFVPTIKDFFLTNEKK